jgi:hypothetical protein
MAEDSLAWLAAIAASGVRADAWTFPSVASPMAKFRVWWLVGGN